MNKLNINRLLEKYWEAETTLEEEKVLSSYFNGHEVAPEHLPYKPMFQAFSEMSEVAIQEKKKVHTGKTGKVISLNRRVMGIAASFLILVFVGMFYLNDATQTASHSYAGKYTVVTEEEEALEITLQALAYLGDNFEKSSRTINSNFKEMEAVSILK